MASALGSSRGADDSGMVHRHGHQLSLSSAPDELTMFPGRLSVVPVGIDTHLVVDSARGLCPGSSDFLLWKTLADSVYDISHDSGSG